MKHCCFFKNRQFKFICVAMVVMVICSVSSAVASPTTAYTSSGLSASVNRASIVRNKYGVVVQLVLKNTLKKRVYLLMFGGNGIATDTGSLGQLQQIVGMSHCPIDTGTNRTYQSCTSKNQDGSPAFSKDINNYAYIEPGQFATVSYEYLFNNQINNASNASFTLKAIIRTAVAKTDPLGPANPVTDPQVLNINIPLIPLKK